MSVTTKKKEKVKFSKAFWVANTVELLERAAYYGVFVVITLYLSNVLGFTDIQAATIAGVFSACLYLLPTFRVRLPIRSVFVSRCYWRLPYCR